MIILRIHQNTSGLDVLSLLNLLILNRQCQRGFLAFSLFPTHHVPCHLIEDDANLSDGQCLPTGILVTVILGSVPLAQYLGQGGFITAFVEALYLELENPDALSSGPGQKIGAGLTGHPGNEQCFINIDESTGPQLFKTLDPDWQFCRLHNDQSRYLRQGGQHQAQAPERGCGPNQ